MNIIKFSDLLPDFFRYMTTFGGITPRTARDYITRLKFVSGIYTIDSLLTAEKIEEIITLEKNARLTRNKYTRKQTLSDFRSGLHKFLDFLKFDFEKQNNDKIMLDIENINKSVSLTVTEKEMVVQARIGQGYFRQNLIKYWGCCAISGCKMKDILIASHIKPWKDSDNKERIDCFNGLLLLPNYDKLFDRGYISVETDGSIIVSKFLPRDERHFFGLDCPLNIKIDVRHKHYLDYHKRNCFVG